MKSAQVQTISLILTREEAYALCNKLTDDGLVTHGGYCEFNQIKLLQRIGKEVGEIVSHSSAKNDLALDVVAAVRKEQEKEKFRYFKDSRGMRWKIPTSGEGFSFYMNSDRKEWEPWNTGAINLLNGGIETDEAGNPL